MERKYPNLCSPIQLGNTVFRNRMFSAPTAHAGLSHEGHVLESMIENFELRARGGAAAITMSEALVHRKTAIRAALGEAHTAGHYVEVEDVRALPGLANAARAVWRHDSVPSMELNHSGKLGISYAPDGSEIRYSASAGLTKDGKPITEMPLELIKEITQSFGRAAALCKRAGFGMILIHGGHGWLLQQFFSPASNRRRDEYGGSLENRARLTLEVLDSVRKAVGPGFPIELRISGDEEIPGGYTVGDAIELAKLVENKIDLLHVSTGVHGEEYDRWQPDMFKPRGVNVHYAAEIKKHISIPVATVGALNDPEMMEEIIATGKADVVEMARALMADPELPNKIMSGREDEIVYCLRCFVCLTERMKTGVSVCSVNPHYSREREALSFAPAAAKKRVLVAGGGPGGMQAALTAARRGHKVTLCERRSELGGALLCEKGVSFKEDMLKNVAAVTRQMERAGVEIRLNTEVTADYAEKEAPDVLIVAAGGLPLVPNIPGIDDPRVIMAEDIPEKRDRIGKRVVMLGGGQVGCEAAVHLAMEGHEVTVIEMQDELAPDAGALRHRPALLKKMEDLGVRGEVKTRASRFGEGGLFATGPDGCERFFPADTLICAVGRKPARDAADSLRDAAPTVRFIGDCVKVARLAEATFTGYSVALDV